MNIKKLTINQKELRRRILDISYEAKSSHIGSCLSAVDLIDAVYEIKRDKDRFVLSSGHAGVALYAVLEKKGILSNPNLEKFHVHPDRDEKSGIDVSTGSLGQGLPIALGMAMADRSKNVYCILSDGECAEGSIWESLRVAYEQKVSNLYILINANGWGGYDPVSIKHLIKRLKGFLDKLIVINGHDTREVIKNLVESHNSPNVIFTHTISDQFPFLKGQDAHYFVMSEQDYKQAKEILK